MSFPDDDFQRLPSEKHSDLPKWTRDLLDELRPEEAEALRIMARLGPEGTEAILTVARLGPKGTNNLLAAIELAQSVATVAKFVKWLVIGCLGIFFASMLFAEKIITLLSWIGKGRGP